MYTVQEKDYQQLLIDHSKIFLDQIVNLIFEYSMFLMQKINIQGS